MTTKEMDKLIAHCDRYFGQTEPMILHHLVQEPHVDVLRYPPNEAYPFWKLVTMGASDFFMPRTKPTLGNRNEYVMFIDPQEDLEDPSTVGWYVDRLYLLAVYPRMQNIHVTYGHSVEWGEEEDSNMVSAFLEMPQIIPNVGFLRCKLGLLKKTVLLQAIPLTRQETDRLLELGPQEYSERLYPDDGGQMHFLAQQYRTEKF